MMNRKEFYEYVKDNVKDYLPDSYQNGEIRIEEVAKNKGLRLTGISIPQGDQRAVPMVYLYSLFHCFHHIFLSLSVNFCILKGALIQGPLY